MDLKSIFADDEAVSPVIGVILMVAITVILAAVIGTFVLGLGDQVQSTNPQASFTFEFTDTAAGTADLMEVTHDGGDSISSDRLTFTASGVTAKDGNGNSYAAEVRGNNDSWTNLNSGTTVDVGAGSAEGIGSKAFNESGTTTQLPNDKDGAGGAEEVEFNEAKFRVVWTSSSGDNSATLGQWEGPDA